MNLTASTRFSQIEMASLFFTNHRPALIADLNASHQRFIVTDLV